MKRPLSLALVLTGLLYFFAAFSNEGAANGTLPSVATAVRLTSPG